MVKKGDTLIEVTLAVGIFSMVAIAIVAVMSSGISTAQTSLETTLTREEIDTQAEAIRFIHSAYVGDQQVKDSPYVKLWQAITNGAEEVSSDEAEAKSLLQFQPSTCQSIYDSLANAFIINPRALNSLNSDSDINTVYISSNRQPAKFTQTTTYPRLVYTRTETSTSTTDNTSLYEGNDYSSLYRAEGIYVIAVKGNNDTFIVDKADQSGKKSAFYDFYIRACWYGSNASEPSTISTVIRLYNPDAITSN